MQIRCCINFIELKFVVVDWLRLLIFFYVVFRSNASSSSTYLEAQLDFRWVFLRRALAVRIKMIQKINRRQKLKINLIKARAIEIFDIELSGLKVADGHWLLVTVGFESI